MRFFSTLFMFLTTMEFAGAHSLDGDHSLAEQLGHQVVGSHHLPMTIILITAALVALSKSYRLVVARKRH